MTLVHYTLASGMKSAGNGSPISTATMFIGLFLLMDFAFLKAVFITFISWPVLPTPKFDIYLLIPIYFASVIFSVKLLIQGKKNYTSIVKANKVHGLKYARWSVFIWALLSFAAVPLGGVLVFLNR